MEPLFRCVRCATRPTKSHPTAPTGLKYLTNLVWKSTRPKQPVSYEQCLLIVPQVFQHVYEHDRIKPPFAVHQFFERCRQHLNVSETESLDLPGHVGFGLQRNESTRGPSYPPSEVADAGADLEYRARDVRLECGKHPLLVSGGRPQQL